MKDCNSLTYACLTIKSEVYEAFVNPEDSFREGPFYTQITQNLLLYLRMFHEWGPMCVCVRVLSLQSSVIHGFVTEPWHSRHVLFSCERACALSSACLVSCWSVVFRSWHSCLEFRFRVGVWTLVFHVLSCCVSVRSWVRSAVHSSVHVCCVLCCTQFVFLLAVCIHVMSCAVWHTACVFHWLHAFMFSCLVWTRGL